MNFHSKMYRLQQFLNESVIWQVTEIYSVLFIQSKESTSEKETLSRVRNESFEFVCSHLITFTSELLHFITVEMTRRHPQLHIWDANDNVCPGTWKIYSHLCGILYQIELRK